VHASTATSISGPSKRSTQRVTAAGVASIRPRLTSPELGVQGIEGDLCSMHVKPGYDRHRGLL
jgi:hypothetical protein